MNKILIIKFGALGDVVRTSYFAESLKKKEIDVKIFWVTAKSSKPLLDGNPFIDFLTTEFEEIKDIFFDHVYSLDDEIEIVSRIEELSFSNLSGAFLDTGGVKYTNDVSEWFDMGLLSKHGKVKADYLKKKNIKSHSEIFKKIFDVNHTCRNFFYPAEFVPNSNLLINDKANFILGINPYAGGRWPSKELLDQQIELLLKNLFEIKLNKALKIVLLGSGVDRVRNIKIKSKLDSSEIYVPDTNNSVLDFAYQVKQLDYLITTDSLALHLAISQGVRCTAFFAPTSAAEIDSFELCEKIISHSDDYCNYSKNCDNSSITALRLVESFQKNMLVR